jgi:hypothetical protein
LKCSEYKGYGNYPEFMHKPSEHQSRQFNAHLLKDMIQKKMEKNGHFQQSQIALKFPHLFRPTLVPIRQNQEEKNKNSPEHGDSLYDHSAIGSYRVGKKKSVLRIAN